MGNRIIPIIDWRVTYSCDNVCAYCFGTKSLKRISLEDEDIIIKKIIDFPCKIIDITGGEPLLEEERCLNIITRLINAGKKIYLSSNGTNMLKNLDFIRNNISFLGLPLDGYDEISCCLNGRFKTSFLNIISVLNVLKNNEKKPRIKIGTVITKYTCNRDFLFKMKELLTDFNIDIWRLYEVLPVNRGALNRDKLELNDEDRKHLVDWVNELKEIKTNFKIELVTREMRNSAYFIIQADGSVIFPKDDLEKSEEIVIGNLVEEDINDIYKRWLKLVKISKSLDYDSTRNQDIEG